MHHSHCRKVEIDAMPPSSPPLVMGSVGCQGNGSKGVREDNTGLTKKTKKPNNDQNHQMAKSAAFFVEKLPKT